MNNIENQEDVNHQEKNLDSTLSSASQDSEDSSSEISSQTSLPPASPLSPAPLKLHSSTRHLLDYQSATHKKIFLRLELLQKLQDKILPYFHEKLQASIALSYHDSGALVLMINNPALAVKIQRQQAHLDQLVAEELHLFLRHYLSQKRQLHLLAELSEQLLPSGKISLLIRPFYKNI